MQTTPFNARFVELLSFALLTKVGGVRAALTSTEVVVLAVMTRTPVVGARLARPQLRVMGMLVMVRQLAIEGWLPVAPVFVELGVSAALGVALASWHVVATLLGSRLHHSSMRFELF